MKTFLELYEATVKSKLGSEVEQKGKFDYLSWAYAVKHMKINFPDSVYRIVKYPDDKDRYILPYLKSELGYFVATEIKLNKDSEWVEYPHPILDNYNKPVQKPTPFQVNTSIQRCLTKNIAVVTGIGLSLYAGEDLPDLEKNQVQEKKSNPLEIQKEYLEMFSRAKDSEQIEKAIKYFFRKYPELKTDKDFQDNVLKNQERVKG